MFSHLYSKIEFKNNDFFPSEPHKKYIAPHPAPQLSR
jgi:hypothetical protein